jgi:hypothetical protein
MGGNKKIRTGQVLVAHACNPRYSGGTDQEGRGSKPAPANSLGDPISKIPITKKGGLVEWLKEWALSSKPSTIEEEGEEEKEDEEKEKEKKRTG